MKHYLGAAVCLAAALLCLICIEIFRELHRFVITRYEIRSPKLPEHMNWKIVFMSDLHNHEYGEDNRELIRAVRKEKPDLILVAGDMLVGKKGHSWDAAARFMKQLPAIAPVYYSNGNHEQRMHENTDKYGDAYWRYKAELEEAGVVFLVNESISPELGGGQISLSGIEIPIEYYDRPRKKWLSTAEVEACIGRPDPDSYRILLAHHPEYAEVYREWGADLVLSGHLHGGIMRLPVLGGVISPQAGLFPKYSGSCYRVGDTSIVVSKGLGTHTVNIRLWNPAELIVLHVGGRED